MTWKEIGGLEKDIVLCVRKKNKSISEISNQLGKASPTISEAVSRMVSENTVSRNHEYSKDARFAKVSLNKEMIRIKKTHNFYFRSFFLSFFLIVVSTIMSFFLISVKFLLGTLLGIFPPFFYMLYQAYIIEDKIVVEKIIIAKK